MTPLAPPFGSPRSGRKGMLPRLPILGTVDDLGTTAEDGAVILTFSTPVGATKYLPQFKASASETWIDDADPDDPPNILDGSVEHTVGALTNDTAYDFRVVVFDLFGSTTSGAVSETPTATAGFGTVTNLASSAQGDTTLTYEWTQVADDLGNPAKYSVRIRTPTLSPATWGEVADSEIFVDTNLAIGVSKAVQFTGLTAGTDYEAMLIPFRGEPGSADAFGEFSNSAAATTTGTSVLGTISDLAASPGDTQVALSWSPAENATSHQPQYKLSSSGTWLDFGAALGASASNVTVTGLTNDNAYDFRIEAGDGATTTNSNEVSATPEESTSGEPAGFTQLRVWNGTALVPSGWTEVGPNQPAKHSRVAQGGLPSGNTHFYRHTYPSGMSIDGQGTEFLDTTPSGWFKNTASCPRLYISYWLRPDANWIGHQSGVNKLHYIMVRKDGGGFGHHFIIMAFGVGTNPLKIGILVQGHTWCSNNGAQYIGSQTLPRGQWSFVELLFENNTPGNSDGKMQMWVDGNLAINEGDGSCHFQFHNHSSDDNFVGINTDAIYGGRGTGSLSQTQTMDMDHIYVSGGPR